MRTRAQLAKEAILVQDACNPSGVAYFLVEVFQFLSEEGADTKAKCEDSIVRLVVHKLADLCHIEEDCVVDSSAGYKQAYRACQEMATM